LCETANLSLGVSNLGTVSLDKISAYAKPDQEHNGYGSQDSSEAHPISGQRLDAGDLGRLAEIRLEHFRRRCVSVQPALANLAPSILHKARYGLGFHTLGHNFQPQFPA
jgi:hypothetical protein